MEFILSTAIGYRLLMCILQEYITLCFVHSSVAKRSELQLHIYLPTGTLSLACGHVFLFGSLKTSVCMLYMYVFYRGWGSLQPSKVNSL